ncbi:MAG: undecaprenyl diphosphate synthase family protein, partial [Holosporaceae bacterium]|nr:undecaprenyl diphosphate synthase family protein [Holosporaceae bacterium]
MSNSLEHIAFILDGNRRWAHKRNIPTLLGHKSGYERLRRITPLLPNYGIKYVTYYMFSMENWNRSSEEINYLLEIFRGFFANVDDFVTRHGIRIIAIGDLKRLPPDIVEKIKYL